MIDMKNKSKKTREYGIDALKERVKELNCLYSLTNIVKDKKMSLDESLQKIVELIPPAWQYPDITCARITVDNKEYKTKNFQVTRWKQTSEIVYDDKKIGAIEVYYLEERPEIDEGPFLIDERRLLDAISDLLGKYIEETKIKKEIDKAEKIIKKAENEKKQDWEVITDLLIKTDPRTLLRLTRKMVYYLYLYENEKINMLLGKICPVDRSSPASQWCGINMPNPRQNLDSLRYIQKQIFELAKESIPPEEISKMFQEWLKQDKARPLLLASQKPGIPLVEITDELTRFFEKEDAENILAPEDKISIKTALIRRFFTNRLDYVNVAKRYIEIEDFVDMLNHTVGPAQGSGKFGGKTSGVFLAEKILKEAMKTDEVLKDISFPKSWYVTSDTILNFIHYNDLDEAFHIKYLPPEQIRHDQPFLEQVFKNATFPHEIIEGFRKIIRDLEGKPIIVRSSSLLEDSFGAAFSGKYKSLFVPNVGSEEERLSALMDAIAEVYASTFGPDPIEYRRERGLLDFSEEMGVLVQEVVGKQIGHYFMPVFAGVAFSRNEFSWSPRIRREDGMVRLVPGLGTRAVDRVGDDYPILVSPNRPNLRVNTLISEQVQYSPRYMDVINLKSKAIETVDAIEFFREHSEEFPKLENLVSVYKDDRLVEPNILTDFKKEDLVITFNNLFEKTDFLEKMKRILRLLEDKIGTPVDVEFASDGDKLYILQCRPQSQGRGVDRKPIPSNIPNDRKLFSANKYVTTGQIENIEYIIYVVPEEYANLSNVEEMQKIATIVNELNNKLPNKKFILIGPGRWGSRGDIRLGVPVKYGDIKNTSLLVEVAKEKGGYIPELSFGTHFFQDLVESNIKYLPLYPDQKDTIFNEELLTKTENYLAEILPKYKDYEKVVKVVKTQSLLEDSTLSVIMDGEANEALAFLQPLDHWRWRMQKVREISEELDPDLYGIVALYIIGSTKTGEAGPASDIDLLIQIKGTEEQKEKLLNYMEKLGKKLAKENEQRTGIKTENLLDVHIITEEDIKNRTAWATHITSPYMSVKKIELKKKKEN
ncbi:MAG: pyruvate, phosphate dikinase [Thermoplasmata archaeon]|nr:MAG: pyruvate, phosphate dikinase [Thermoplasmata archaeon]